jgi:hypothetical protein
MWKLEAAIIAVEIVGTEVCGQGLKAVLFKASLESKVSHSVRIMQIRTLVVGF